jgi:hypothetical protein
MLRPETDIAVLVLPLVVITQRVSPCFSRVGVEPATRKYATSGFYPHHRRARTAVLNWGGALKAGLDPVIDVALPRNVVGRHPVVRQVDDCVLPTSTSQLGGVKSEGLANTFDVIKQPDLTMDELANPDLTGSTGSSGTCPILLSFRAWSRWRAKYAPSKALA